MPSTGSLIQIKHGTLAAYTAATKDANTIYFITDAKKVFVGDTEYTEAVISLSSAPTSTTSGVEGRIYHYNGTLYIYSGSAWTKVANYNDKYGTVTSVAAGSGLTGGTITGTGTIAHAVPAQGTPVDSDLNPTFGGTFDMEEVQTDTFGHVIARNTITVTLPSETAISVTTATGTAKTLAAGESFTVVTEVAKGSGSHEVKRTATTFTLPADKNTTYSLAAGTTDGSVKLVSSDGTEVHADVVVKGWSDIAKKSDISAVLKFKGSVATQSALPTSASVGDVYHVTATGAEFVYTEDGWEELGITVSLDGYATTASVNAALASYQKLVTGATDKIAVFNAAGQVVAGAKTIDELISQLTYVHPSYTSHAAGLYKVTVDATGHVSAAAAVTISDINALGTVAKATADASGNNIASTYATKAELTASKLVWQAI